MNRRIEILRHAIVNRSFGGSFSDWRKNVFAPTCSQLASKFVTSVQTEEGFTEIQLRGVARPLFVEQGIDRRAVDQTIAEQFYPWQWHYYEVPETRVDGDVVIDAGCAEGIFALLTERRAKAIYCFEPLPSFLGGLQKTFADSTIVHICPQALGRKPSMMYLHSNGIESSLSVDVSDLAVEVTTVDAFASQNGVSPSYIKADIEGFEVEFLNGAVETILQNRPKIAITTYHVGSHAQEISDLLRRIHPSYKIRVKGIEERVGAPVMLHAW